MPEDTTLKLSVNLPLEDILVQILIGIHNFGLVRIVFFSFSIFYYKQSDVSISDLDILFQTTSKSFDMGYVLFIFSLLWNNKKVW
jgi:hypothetical protein